MVATLTVGVMAAARGVRVRWCRSCQPFPGPDRVPVPGSHDPCVLDPPPAVARLGAGEEPSHRLQRGRDACGAHCS